MADNTTQIAEIRSTLASGVKTTTVDGQTVVLDLDSMRQELRRLIAEDDATTANLRRPHTSSVNMAGFN